MKRILYLTYDGLTDPLGQSQILPYLVGLSKSGYRFTILSFEKPGRYQKEKNTIEKITSEANINWVPLRFTSQPPLLSKFYDAVRMRQAAVKLHKANYFDMVHCRSYIAADVGLYLKKRFGIKFFFDMRGFWADEKKDGGSWNVSNPFFRRVYNYYKKKEADYLSNADYIISLTEAGKKEMLRWDSFNSSVPLSVIPCCADMNVFTVTTKEAKQKGRQLLNIENDVLVLSYLGSVGTWYMLDEMLQLFSFIKKKYADAVFLFVTHSDPAMLYSRLEKYQLQRSDLRVVEARRHEVPVYVKASDINVSFIKPVYSKISSSPTKLGEVLSMGIPVISNSGVGDVEKTINDLDCGFVFHSFSEDEYRAAVASIPGLLDKDPQTVREKAKTIYSLDAGIRSYATIYNNIFQASKPVSHV